MEECKHCHTGGNDVEEHEEEMSLKKIIIAAVLFALGLAVEHIPLAFLNEYLSFLGNGADASRILSGVIYLAAYLVCGKSVVIGALQNLFKGKILDEQFLMTIASLGAVFTGEFPEAVAVMLFYQVGEYFQDYAVDKSRDSIQALMNIRPDTADVIRNGKTVTVDACDVKTGETVVVKPGERIPVDGIITKGKTFIDNSALTGESVPLEVFEGNEVFSGAINTASVIEIKTVRIAEESAATRILHLVEESAAKKAKSERFITRFSKVYTPIVCALAAAVAVIPPLVLKFGFPQLFAQYGWNVWIYRALIFLVVSCPCAIVISVPLTFFGGIGAGSRQGILVKGSGALETLATIKTAVFDKTGTLTKGVFVVTDVHCLHPEKFPEDELIAIAAHAEIYSNHPAAKSLKAAHHGECCSLAKVTDAQEISGEGIKVCLDGKTVLAGNEQLMQNQNVTGYEKCSMTDAGTVVHVAVDGEYAGHIIISDRTKEDAAQAVKELHSLGVNKIVMLTGDNQTTAEAVAKETGVDEFYSNLLPQDKVTKVEELISQLNDGRKKRGALAFAGDGINDAPVLARADVGIAMGGLGADAAIESADVVIMDDEPSKIAAAIRTSRKTLSIVKQNIIFSLAVKIAIMVLGAAGIANMWLAVFGDTGVAVLAILNAMRATAKVKKS